MADQRWDTTNTSLGTNYNNVSAPGDSVSSVTTTPEPWFQNELNNHDAEPRGLTLPSHNSTGVGTAVKKTYAEAVKSKSFRDGRHLCRKSEESAEESFSDRHTQATDSSLRGNGSKVTVHLTTEYSSCQTNRDSVPDTVCIFDIAGRLLEPGDVIWFGRAYKRREAVYVGKQLVVFQDWKPGERVRKEILDLTQPIGKFRVISGGETCGFSPKERIKRAVSRVGTEFTEGASWEFAWWVYTGMGLREAWSKHGFQLVS